MEQLVGVTMPAPPLPRDLELPSSIDPLIEESADHFADWAVVSLMVADAPSGLRTMTWAGAWTAG